MGRWQVLRLDYLFSVIVPCLIAVYVNGLALGDHLMTIAGWAFLGIAGNIINDMVDKDRDLGMDWHSKELAAIALGAIMLGFLCLSRAVITNVLNLVWIAIAVVLILAYCFKLKKIPVASSLVQVLAEIPMPYFTVHVPTSGEEWLWLLAVYEFGVLGQIVHEAVDRESISHFSTRAVRAIVAFFSAVLMATGAFLFLISLDVTILPFTFVPLSTMYIFRSPTVIPAKNIKDVGIIMGNLFMAYFLAAVLATA